MRARVRVMRGEPLRVPVSGEGAVVLTDGETRVPLSREGGEAVLDDAALAHFPGLDQLTLEEPGGAECVVVVIPNPRS